MIEKNDWRLLNNVEQLNGKYVNPTDGKEIFIHALYLKRCAFCWEPVKNSPQQRWYIPDDVSCCICEECYQDFKDMLEWKQLDGWDIDWK